MMLRWPIAPHLVAQAGDEMLERAVEAHGLAIERGQPFMAIGMGAIDAVATGDLVDEPGEPTRAALDQVLDLFRRRLVEA